MPRCVTIWPVFIVKLIATQRVALWCVLPKKLLSTHRLIALQSLPSVLQINAKQRWPRLNRQSTYVIEGSIFTAGAVTQWLHEELDIITNAEQSAALTQTRDTTDGTYLVPAFPGLGAPYWNPEARGALLELPL